MASGIIYWVNLLAFGAAEAWGRISAYLEKY